MYIKTNKSKIFFTKDKNLESIPTLFIHGFTGSSKSWKHIRDKINFQSIAIDIPGHGKSTFNDIDDKYLFSDFSHELFLCLNSLNIKKLNICGYSMGGRLGLCFAAKYPMMINSLILESSTLGIESNEDKNIVLDSDALLAESINNNMTNFMSKWNKNELFKFQKSRNPDQYQLQNRIRLNHHSNQLSHSLLSFSKGNMPYMLHQYQKFTFPTLIINGKDDTKYIKEGRKMLKLNNNTKQYIVDQASHNVHIENSDIYIDIINNFINE